MRACLSVIGWPYQRCCGQIISPFADAKWLLVGQRLDELLARLFVPNISMLLRICFKILEVSARKLTTISVSRRSSCDAIFDKGV